MALEEFILDLCEESVNAALLVGFKNTVVNLCQMLRCAVDILALPNIPPRPLVQSTIKTVPNMSENIQQGPAYCIRGRGASGERKDQGEYTAGDSFG